MNLIKLNNVNKNFENVRVLKDINLEINEGTLLAVVGESGSGKSTLGKIISKIIKVSNGELKVNGKVSMIYQEYSSSLNPRFSILDVLEEVYIVKKEKIDINKIKEIIEFVSLSHIDLKKNVNILSGGEKQRLVIARAILFNPDIYIFDEAISSLDIHLQLQIIDIVKKLNEVYGKTIIFITHNVELLKYITEDILVLKNGEIVERGNILKESKTTYTKKLLNIWKC
ncbi:dipeptide/oligopeptide/nickel ABC transporter ATP-binding protein [Streptobacillus ratti]|uniref:ABC transporter ATP-binding protein n=1 Tax=Streptobacillus ratti TaxID=1720557 RepID=UPI0009334E9E|nr:dipeptide/oligopeptide/nickel ABC transporter ATP-binding protein [Streptobacillus ratti]